ncbi:MAG TPA: hypothetical protein VGU02_11105 [Gaiellaceae bacterium]|nr:hypothetical protein [Gaiellaceae bacterium]
MPSASHGSHWFVLRSGLRSHVVKQRALRAYRSQLPLLGPFCRARVGAFELLRRGETVCGGDDLVAALTHMEILR